MKLGEYQCTRCDHTYKVPHGIFPCNPNFEGKKCGAQDPALCNTNPECWGCSSCGRSQRQIRCAMCVLDKNCPRCGCHIVQWLNYEEFVVDN